MDLKQFDQRGAAEKGSAFILLDPDTNEPIVDDSGAAEIILRGAASKSVQERLRQTQIELMNSDEDQAVVMEDVHQGMIDAALPFVIGFNNVEIGGVTLTGSEEDVRRFLDMTFPRMGVDEDGNPKLMNNPFAKQVIDNASNYSAFLGNG